MKKKQSNYQKNKKIGELYRSDPSTNGLTFTEYKKKLKALKKQGL